MTPGDGEPPASDPYADALNAARLGKRIAAVTNRVGKPVPVPRPDGTILLRGRRRSDRSALALDRRAVERRRPPIDPTA